MSAFDEVVRQIVKDYGGEEPFPGSDEELIEAFYQTLDELG